MAENIPDTNVGNNEYISKQAALECVTYDEEYTTEQIKSLPAADVVPVVHSRWIKTADGAECENCGREAVYQIVDDHWEYEPRCPHCGAKMDGKE